MREKIEDALNRAFDGTLVKSEVPAILAALADQGLAIVRVADPGADPIGVMVTALTRWSELDEDDATIAVHAITVALRSAGFSITPATAPAEGVSCPHGTIGFCPKCMGEAMRCPHGFVMPEGCPTCTEAQS